LNKYTIFATEFFPTPGGITEYTHSLATALSNQKLLNDLISVRNHNKSLLYSNRKFFFKNIENPTNRFSKKIFSLLIRCMQYAYFYYYTFLKVFFSGDDILIFNSLFVNLTWHGIFISRFFKKRYCIVLHGLDILEFYSKKKNLLNLVCENSQCIITNSNATKKLIIDHYLLSNSDKIKVIYPVIEFAPIRFNNLYVPNEVNHKKEKIIISICRLVKRKGIDLSILGASNILKKNKDWQYIICGVGPELDTLKTLVNSLHLEKQIHFYNYIPNSDKFKLLSNSSIFLQPNNCQGSTNWEGFGISFIEAQYFQNVVIGGKNGGVVESVKDGTTGFLIDFDFDPINQIEKHLTFLISSESIRRKMGISARDFVIASFLIKNMENQVYDKLNL
jgi:glycosyltransferase involved in cell wall biosynthesis